MFGFVSLRTVGQFDFQIRLSEGRIFSYNLGLSALFGLSYPLFDSKSRVVSLATSTSCEMGVAFCCNIFPAYVADRTTTARADEFIAAIYFDDRNLAFRTLVERSFGQFFLQNVPLIDSFLLLVFLT